jgi:hypothetical protein
VEGFGQNPPGQREPGLIDGWSGAVTHYYRKERLDKLVPETKYPALFRLDRLPGFLSQFGRDLLPAAQRGIAAAALQAGPGGILFVPF